MKFIAVSALVGTLGLSSCKTSEYRNKADDVETRAGEKNAPRSGTSQTTGSGVPAGSPAEDPSTNNLQLNQSCDKPVQLRQSQVRLSFPERKKCAFNVGLNREPKAGHLQAVEMSSANLQLPENSEICSMILESPADAALRYEDLLILTVDDFVIFSSSKDLVPKLEQLNGVPKWDFLKLRESPLDFNAAPYCMAATDRCDFPHTGGIGPVLLKLNASEISGISKAIKGKVVVPVDLITTGDLDDALEKSDCSHSALDLTVTLQYIKKTN